MKTLKITGEMLDFLIKSMEGKKKRLLFSEPDKEFSPFENIGSLTIQMTENSAAEKRAHDERRTKWEQSMNMTEKMIDLLNELKDE